MALSESAAAYKDALAAPSEWLVDHTLLTARTYPGMGHRIGAAMLADAAVFLRHYVLGPGSAYSQPNG